MKKKTEANKSIIISRREPSTYVLMVLDPIGRTWYESGYGVYSKLGAYNEVRSRLAADWLVREYLPAWLELAGVKDAAASIRALHPVLTPEALIRATPLLEIARKKAFAARASACDASRDEASDAAGSAAENAAWSTTWAAAATAASYAAGLSAAWSAAFASVWSAAWAAAGAAAWSKAKAKIEPTAAALRESSLQSLRKMIDC